jgi:hypothetical protein
MNETSPNLHDRSTLSRLPLLIDLFYGFSIANGLSDAIKSTIEKRSMFQWLFLGAALLLGLGDWLGYHVHVSHIPYRSLRRLLLDLLFPILVYCLLLAPTLTPSAAGVSYVGWIVLIYFAFATLYSVLLHREVWGVRPSLLRVVLIALAMSFAAVLSGFLFQSLVLRTVLGDFLATAAVGLWAYYNLLLVYQTMHSDSEAITD